MSRLEYAEAIKSAALKMGDKLVMDYLVAQIPFFSWPLINPIVGFIVTTILKIAIRETEFGLFFTYIDLRTQSQSKDFESAALRNAIIQKNGTKQEKANAEAELVKAFRAFVKFTN